MHIVKYFPARGFTRLHLELYLKLNVNLTACQNLLSDLCLKARHIAFSILPKLPHFQFLSPEPWQAF